MAAETLNLIRAKASREGKRKKKREKRNLVKERQIIGAVLLVSTLLSSLFYFKTNRPKLNFHFKAPSFSPFFIKINHSAPKSPKKLEDLFLETISGQEKNWALWIEDLNSGFNFSHQSQAIFPAGFLTRLPAVITLYQQIESGERSLKEEIILSEKDFQGGKGSLKNEPPETKVTLEQLISFALEEEDNSALAIIKRLLTEQVISRNTYSLGLINTSLPENTTTAQDLGLFLKRLYQQELLSQDFTNQFLDHLTNPKITNPLKEGVPLGIKVASQSGEEINSLANVGLILVPDRPLIFVFLSKDLNQKQAQETIRYLTLEIYWFLLAAD